MILKRGQEIYKIRLEYLLKSESKDTLKTQKNEMRGTQSPRWGPLKNKISNLQELQCDCISVQPC